MTEPVTVRSALLPMVAMWAVILLAIAFLADSTSTRVWMTVIGAGATLGLMLRVRLDARRA